MEPIRPKAAASGKAASKAAAKAKAKGKGAACKKRPAAVLEEPVAPVLEDATAAAGGGAVAQVVEDAVAEMAGVGDDGAGDDGEEDADLEIEKVVNYEIDGTTGEKRCLVRFVDRSIVSDWRPESTLPADMRAKINPGPELLADLPAEIELVWQRQAWQATCLGKERFFGATKWRGWLNAKEAALRWVADPH